MASQAESGGCVWITGASSGLGRALATALARQGRIVVASARSKETLDAVAAECREGRGRIVAMPLDVTDRSAAAAAAESIEREVGMIDLAVLNAGTHKPDSAGDFDAGAVREILDLNLMGVVHGLEALLPRMMGRGRGQIAIVASLAGCCGLPYAAAYGASKAGLINLAESLRPELQRAGVKLQIVNPGFVRTPLTDRNDFPMPFLMELDDAVAAFLRGLASERFEIFFPRRLAYVLKLLRLLPYPLYFALTRRLLRDQSRVDG